MSEILDVQTCPYCSFEAEDHQSFWEEGEEEEVTCSRCDEAYISKPQYNFEGWVIERKCSECKEFTEDGYKLCDCGEPSEISDVDNLQRLSTISTKKVLETTCNTLIKEDIDFLLSYNKRIKEENKQVKEAYQDRCDDIDFYVRVLEEIVNQIEGNLTKEEIFMGDELVKTIYKTAVGATTISDYY